MGGVSWGSGTRSLQGSRAAEGVKTDWFWLILSLPFCKWHGCVDLIDSNLQQENGQFATECKASGMRITISKSEAMVLGQKKMDGQLWVKNELLENGGWDWQTTRAASAVMQMLKWSFVVRESQARRQSFQFVNLGPNSHLWSWALGSDRKKKIKAAKMSFLHRVVGLSLGRYFGHSHPGGDPRADQGHTGEIISLIWLGNVLVSPQRSWYKWPEELTSGSPYSNGFPYDPDPDEWQKTKHKTKHISAW